jgi:hypothetical protein
MASSTTQDRSTTKLRSATGGIRPVDENEQRIRPVVGWAWAGAVSLATALFIFSSWILSGPERTPPGPTPFPTRMNVMLQIMQWTTFGFSFVMLYVFLIRPWRRDRKVTLDGLFIMAFWSIYWQDPILNYTNMWFSYNSHFLNFGSWLGHVPGVVTPNASRVVEPIVFTAPFYAFWMYGLVMAVCGVLRRAKARWPSMTPARLVGLAFLTMCAVDLVFEPFLMWSSAAISYPAGPGPTLFKGTYYQYPIVEMAMSAFLWTGWICLRYFANDRGETIVERGIDRVRTTARRRTVVRYLALAGICNGIYLFGYNLPTNFVALHATDWPADISQRSYLTNLVCGPGTTYACPGPRIPIPRPNSLHVSPEGRLEGP